MSKNRGMSDKRADTRGKGLNRPFSNKAGVQLVVTRYYDEETKLIRFMKSLRILQREDGKTILGHKYS
jgi:hypothetical protein